MAVFVADNPSICGLKSDGAAALLSACSLVRCCSHQFAFPCPERLLQGISPPSTISREALPGHSIDVDILYISYADIFISQVRAAGGSPPQCQLTVDDVFWNANILDTADMTQPSQSALPKQSVHTGKTSTRHHIGVGNFVLPLPGYAQDTADVSRVECVESSLLPGICCQRLAAMQQCAGNTGIVDTICVFTDSLGLVHTRAVRRARLAAAFPILLSIYASKEGLSVMVELR